MKVLLNTILNAKNLKHFDWGNGILIGNEHNQILKFLNLYQSQNLVSLGIAQLYNADYLPSLPLNLNLKFFVFCNLKLLTINYLQLSEDLLILLLKKSIHFEHLKIILQNSIRNIPLIR